MMQQPPAHHPHKHIRFYIVTITVIIGIILLILFMNSDGDGIDLTGAVVGSLNSSENTMGVNQVTNSKIGSDATDIEFSLAVDQVPVVKKNVEVGELTLQFDDTTTSISVNGDKLELANLDEVVLVIENYEGSLEFDAARFSLVGSATRIEFNDVALSSRNKLQISFNDLNYNYFNIEDVEIDEIKLPPSDGKLLIGEQLSYILDDESLTLASFSGNILVDKGTNGTVAITGVTDDLAVDGEFFDLLLE
jgi:ABC-type Na+ efflux pump permease subunit